MPAEEARVCREAAGECDVEEVCDGRSLKCPPDSFADRGTPCTDATGADSECLGGKAQKAKDPYVLAGRTKDAIKAGKELDKDSKSKSSKKGAAARESGRRATPTTPVWVPSGIPGLEVEADDDENASREWPELAEDLVGPQVDEEEEADEEAPPVRRHSSSSSRTSRTRSSASEERARLRAAKAAARAKAVAAEAKAEAMLWVEAEDDDDDKAEEVATVAVEAADDAVAAVAEEEKEEEQKDLGALVEDAQKTEKRRASRRRSAVAAAAKKEAEQEQEDEERSSSSSRRSSARSRATAARRSSSSSAEKKEEEASEAKTDELQTTRSSRRAAAAAAAKKEKREQMAREAKAEAMLEAESDDEGGPARVAPAPSSVSTSSAETTLDALAGARLGKLKANPRVCPLAPLEDK